MQDRDKFLEENWIRRDEHTIPIVNMLPLVNFEKLTTGEPHAEQN